MLDISSKQWHLKVTDGVATVKSRDCNVVFTVDPSEVPPLSRLAAMTEASFDRCCSTLLRDHSV